MDARRFDALARLIGSRASRRVAIGLATTGLLALAAPEAEALRCSKNKPCPECKRCRRRRCKPDATKIGTACTDDGNPCTKNVCNESGTCSHPNEADGVSCGGGKTCQNGVCACGSGEFQCTEVARCCQQEQACLAESCGACPDSPDPCTSAAECGFTNPNLNQPYCYCVTSIDDATTCTSVFVNPFQAAGCTNDAECKDILGAGVDAVCIYSPCFDLGIDYVCVNKGCVDLTNTIARAESKGNAPTIRQMKFR